MNRGNIALVLEPRKRGNLETVTHFPSKDCISIHSYTFIRPRNQNLSHHRSNEPDKYSGSETAKRENFQLSLSSPTREKRERERTSRASPLTKDEPKRNEPPRGRKRELNWHRSATLEQEQSQGTFGFFRFSAGIDFERPIDDKNARMGRPTLIKSLSPQSQKSHKCGNQWEKVRERETNGRHRKYRKSSNGKIPPRMGNLETRKSRPSNEQAAASGACV